MTAVLIAPFAEFTAQDRRGIGIGADVVALTGYVPQRLELVLRQIGALPACFQPSTRSLYA